MATSLDIDHLARSPIFAVLDRAMLAHAIDQAKVLEYAAGETVFEAGEPYRHALFVVYEGEVELQREGTTWERLRSGAVLGLSNYIDGEPYRSSARALQPSRLWAFPEPTIKSLEDQCPAFFDALNHQIAERLRDRGPQGAALTGTLTRPVRSAMKSPLATCDSGVTLSAAYRLMRERRIGSLGVVADDDRLVGILTCAGIAEAVTLKGASPDDTVMEAACEQPHTIESGAPLWHADELLQRYGVKYLIAVEGGKSVGIISQTDILRALVTQRPILVERVAAAEDLAQLRQLYDTIHEVAREARESNRLASRAVRIVSDVHLAIQQRCAELTLRELDREGHGPPPRGYTLLVMGSGGRREMLLTPDQDNGIILADEPGPLSDAEQAWFERFSARLNDNLARCGYILCPGEIMARNPMFRKTLSGWKRQISRLAQHPNQKAARWSNIVFDFDTLSGDDALTRELRVHILNELKRNRLLLEFMVEDDAEGRPPLGLFNRLITGDEGTGKGKIDVKRNGLRIIADAARVYALGAGIGATNTTERLQSLVRQGVLSSDLVDSVAAAYEQLLDLLLAHQVEQEQAGESPDKLISPDALSSSGQAALRGAMRVVKRLQDQLQGQYGRTAF